ncbi:MAG: 5-(carboxyamino)imidazole ribonucleotide mutase [Planctomycetia bacterium]|jgi:5-(carboxyamino)imidazole ribonucleotide mutase
MATKKPGSTSRSKQSAAPLVGVIMGSDSDFGTMKLAADALAEFGIPHEVRVVSAHRTPDDMAEYARGAAARGLKIIIAGAGGAAHLPGMVASHTALPVVGVPIETHALKGLDSLFSIVQMPAGVPTATVGIGNGRNAGLLAVRMLAAHDARLRARYEDWMRTQAEASRKKNEKLVDLLRQG